jgi:hypothetical protein
MSSVALHLFPILLTPTLRWHGTAWFQGKPSAAHPDFPSIENTCSGTALGVSDYSLTLAVYIIWQVLYLIITEWMCARWFEEDKELTSSLRWLTQDSKNALTIIVKSVCRRLGYLKPTENLDPLLLKTKFIFCFTQLLYTVVTLVPVAVLWHYRLAHLVFTVTMLVTAVHNGASFYIEVFSERYSRSVVKKSASYVAHPPSPSDSASAAPLSASAQPALVKATKAGGGSKNQRR